MANARLGLLLLVTASTALAQLASTGLTVTFNNVYYFISPYSSATLDVPTASLDKVPDVFGFKPVTVIQDPISRADIPALLSNWTSLDDVYQPAFSEAIFHADSDAEDHDDTVTVSQLLLGLTSTLVPLSHADTPSGPYFIHPSGALHRVYRLYDDFAAAFTEPLLPTPDGHFQPLSAKIPGSSTLSIGVPSRLYFTPSPQQPLAGVRIGVKDIYRLAGVKGSNGNRAWYHLYPPSNATGTAVQRFIDAGAQIVGLQKTSQFANGELATVDWVDYHAPFNPRGDGYQDPSSSSAGAGASVASYAWLDLALGSDTGGSIRGPAGAQGIFGNRPTHGMVELDEVMPLGPELDTPGFLVRDVELWDRANAVLYGENYSSLSQEKHVEWPAEVYTVGFPKDDTEDPVDKMFLQFAQAVGKLVGENVKPLDLDVKWAKTKPSEAGNVTLTQLLNTTYITIIGRQQTKLVRDPFYRDYEAVHPNRHPFINPSPLLRWSYADTLPAAALSTALAAKSLFQSWFNTHVLPVQKNTCTSSILLYPASTPSYNLPRNLNIGLPPGGGLPFGFSESRISVFAGVPDSVFPLGEAGTGSVSPITGVEEKMPVGVSVLVARGCDGVLVRLAQEGVKGGWVVKPVVGASGVSGGEVLMRRGMDWDM